MGQNKNIFERNISETRFEGKISSASFSGSLTASSAKKNSDYEMLSNKPHINGVELVGDKSFSELGFPEMTEYAKLTDIPSMLPANGGDADTVNGHTVNSDIPENAVFTDTTHSDISAEGCILQLGGLQGNVPFSITVSGKNLVYYDIEKIQNAHTAGKWDKNVYTISNVVVTFGTDGIIAMSGTAAANIAIALNWNTNNTMIELAAGSYTISGCPKQNGLSLKLVSSDGSEVYTCQETCTIDVRGGKYKFYINAEKNTVLESVNICAQLEFGTTATDYELPIVGRELTLNVCGKNLIPYPFANSSKTANGITFTDNGDGTVTANGTATADSIFYFSNKNILVNSKNKYYLSGCPSGGSGSTYDVVFASYDEKSIVDANNDTGSGKLITVSENAKTASLYIRIRSGQTIDNMIFRPQLEIGENVTEFESYHGSTVKIAPDSNPYVVPNDIRQQDGLNVVSVSDGTLSVTGVRKNLVLKRIWDKIDEITTAVIVANGEN